MYIYIYICTHTYDQIHVAVGSSVLLQGCSFASTVRGARQIYFRSHVVFTPVAQERFAIELGYDCGRHHRLLDASGRLCTSPISIYYFRREPPNKDEKAGC